MMISYTYYRKRVPETCATLGVSLPLYLFTRHSIRLQTLAMLPQVIASINRAIRLVSASVTLSCYMYISVIRVISDTLLNHNLLIFNTSPKKRCYSI